MIEVWKIQKALFDMYGSNTICMANAHAFYTGLEADFAVITKAGYGYEFEIKRTYADFKNDFKKGYGQGCNKHEDIEQGKGLQNYFSFCFDSKELAEKCLPEIPVKYGVLYAYEMLSGGYRHNAENKYVYEAVMWTKVEHLRSPEKIHDKKMDWKHVAFRVGQSYKSKIFSKVKWPPAPSQVPAWRKGAL